MGHDVVHLGQHTLNTNSAEELAHDISERFGVSVVYGYQDAHLFSAETADMIASFDFILLGKVVHPAATETLQLYDEYYQLHEKHSAMGEEALNLPYFKNSKYNSDELLFSLGKNVYNIYNFDTGDRWSQIRNDIFECNYISYDSRWWFFCRSFTIENNFDPDFEHLNSYRTSLMDFYQKIGCSAVVHCDDQGDHQDLSYDTYSWEELLSEMESRFGGKVFNISSFMKQKELRPMNDYPPIFFDDFADLIST